MCKYFQPKSKITEVDEVMLELYLSAPDKFQLYKYTSRYGNVFYFTNCEKTNRKLISLQCTKRRLTDYTKNFIISEISDNLIMNIKNRSIEIITVNDFEIDGYKLFDTTTGKSVYADILIDKSSLKLFRVYKKSHSFQHSISIYNNFIIIESRTSSGTIYKFETFIQMIIFISKYINFYPLDHVRKTIFGKRFIPDYDTELTISEMAVCIINDLKDNKTNKRKLKQYYGRI